MYRTCGKGCGSQTVARSSVGIDRAAGLLARGDEGPQQLLNEWRQASLPNLSDPVEARHTLQWLFGRSVCTLNTVERVILDAAGLLAHTEFPLAAMSAALGDQKLDCRAALKRLVQLGLLRLSTQQEAHWHFTHVLGYQFARRENGAPHVLRDRLGRWLQRELVELLTRGQLAALPKVVLHIAALLRADNDQNQWSLTHFCLYDAEERVVALGQLNLVVQLLNGVKSWMERLPPQMLDDAQWRRERGVLLNKLGDVQQAQGDLAAALRSYSGGRDIAVALAQSDPSNAQWQRDLSYSLTKLSALAELSGRRDQALEYAEESLAIDERLAALDRSNVTWQNDVHVSRAMVTRLRSV